MKNRLLHFLFGAFLLFFTANGIAQMPVGWWNFDDPSNLTAAVPGYGPDLVLTGTHTTTAGPDVSNGAINIGLGSYYTVTHGIAPNGGGLKVNRYSLMFDFKVDQATGMWHCLFQTDPVVTANDGEYFIRSTTGALGTLDLGYTTPFVVSANTWYRLILSVDNGNFFRAYINGSLVFEHNVRPIDHERYSLAPTIHFFGDDDGDDGSIDVAELAIWDYPLSEAEVSALGGVGIILPVELTSFKASLTDGVVNLQWATETELNNYGFEIERKDINRDWEKLGFVKGNGTTSTTNNYSFIDKPQLAQKYFYRLKQVDFNGSFYYSDIVEITILPVEFKLYNNYPNPFNPSTKIGFNLPTDAFITLKIYNSVGELVAEIMNENKTAGFHQITFDANSLPSGIYFAELKANSTVQRIKMMLVK